MDASLPSVINSGLPGLLGSRCPKGLSSLVGIGSRGVCPVILKGGNTHYFQRYRMWSSSPQAWDSWPACSRRATVFRIRYSPLQQAIHPCCGCCCVDAQSQLRPAMPEDGTTGQSFLLRHVRSARSTVMYSTGGVEINTFGFSLQLREKAGGSWRPWRKEAVVFRRHRYLLT